jgi:hypothetical protein
MRVHMPAKVTVTTSSRGVEEVVEAYETVACRSERVDWPTGPRSEVTCGNCLRVLARVSVKDGRLCANCGHAESLHCKWYWPTEKVVCRHGGIIEPEDVGWQCGCEDFVAGRAPHPALDRMSGRQR